MDNKAIIIIIRNIERCLSDRYPGYDAHIALYNDLLKEISPNHAFSIAYNGKDATLIS